MATRAWAWRWAEVETEAGLARRSAPPNLWAQWRTMAAHSHWLHLDPALWPQLGAFNRALKLRAADAGHLFVFDRALTAVPGIVLVTFDPEIEQAAALLGLPCHRTSP